MTMNFRYKNGRGPYGVIAIAAVVAAMVASLWMKSRSKFATGFVLVMLVPIAIGFMPDKWTDRMAWLSTWLNY